MEIGVDGDLGVTVMEQGRLGQENVTTRHLAMVEQSVVGLQLRKSRVFQIIPAGLIVTVTRMANCVSG